MKIKCEFCGSYISDTDEKCPNCGAPNANMVRSADGVPKTSEDLAKAFCAAHNMPLEKMRFFIGVDFREPRAFGIYRDENGDFIVYKNKADGSRAVRYRGKDEAYAVKRAVSKAKERTYRFARPRPAMRRLLPRLPLSPPLRAGASAGSRAA